MVLQTEDGGGAGGGFLLYSFLHFSTDAPIDDWNTFERKFRAVVTSGD